MPKVPIDYSRTIIYKLVHKDDLDDVNIYVGYTTNYTERKRLHKKCCNLPNDKQYNNKKYQFIRGNGGFENWEMLKVEDYPCKDVYEAKNRERYWIKELKPKLNRNEPLRTDKEYYVDNKEKIAERKKEYRENNREEILKKGKEWYKNNKEKIAEKIECDKCKSIVCRGDISKHKKSKKCKNHVSQ